MDADSEESRRMFRLAAVNRHDANVVSFCETYEVGSRKETDAEEAVGLLQTAVAKRYPEGMKFFLPQNAPTHSEVLPVAAEGDTSQEVPRRQRRRTWRRLLHIAATHWSMKLRKTLIRYHDDMQGPRIRYPGRIRDPQVAM